VMEKERGENKLNILVTVVKNYFATLLVLIYHFPTLNSI
jgi:hypothetical protein